MGPILKRLKATLQVMYYSVFPSSGAADTARPSASATPVDVASIHLFLDSKGEFRVLFRDCLPLAAPFILFRLKRQGYSGCSVEIAEEGLYVRGRR